MSIQVLYLDGCGHNFQRSLEIHRIDTVMLNTKLFFSENYFSKPVLSFQHDAIEHEKSVAEYMYDVIWLLRSSLPMKANIVRRTKMAFSTFLNHF